MTLDQLIANLMTIIALTTPILLAGLGELVVEKSGVLNLGIEGMMLIGAISGFALTYSYGFDYPGIAPWGGVLAAAAGGSLAALLFGFLVLELNSNQVATGLALAIFGGGLSSLIGDNFTGMIITPFGSPFPDDLAGGRVTQLFFGHSPIVYFTFLMVPGVAWFLNRTRAGLILRAVGENDLSAHSIGYSVKQVRYAAIAFGGAMAGIGGAYFSMVITPMWAQGMTAGRGWIALALVVFSGWRVARLFGGAFLFGGLIWLELFAKGGGFSQLRQMLPDAMAPFWDALQLIPSQFWAAMPYLMTVVALTLISRREGAGGTAPACLGRPFLPTA